MTQGIILAAGKGSRLGDITKRTPKSLFKINGTTLVEHNIDCMLDAGLDRVTVVVGYMHERFDYLAEKYADSNLQLVYNPQFATSNTVSSLYETKELFDENAFISTADIFLNGNPYQKYQGDYCYYILRPACALAKKEWVALIDDNLRFSGVDQEAFYGHSYTGISHWTVEGLSILKQKLELVDWQNAAERNQYWDVLMISDLDSFDLRAQLIEDDSEIYEFDDIGDIACFVNKQGQEVVY